MREILSIVDTALFVYDVVDLKNHTFKSIAVVVALSILKFAGERVIKKLKSKREDK
jgi:hypothetical protein